MKILLHVIFSILINCTVFGQLELQSDSVSFDKLLGKFHEGIDRNILSVGQVNVSVSASSLYKTEDFNISISDSPIAFDTLHLVIENPFYTDDLDGYYDNYINHPISYSVIYDDRLVSLFQNGGFVCYGLDSFKRDLDFEKKLNTREFKYHWVVNYKLVAISGDSVFIWNDSNWQKYSKEFPLPKQPKLFEDSEFLVFRDCYGEFGGTVYFFDKANGETYFTESTCANSVIKNEDGYLVLAHLGHFMGFAGAKTITDPRKLTKAKQKEINKMIRNKALGHSDTSNAYKVPLNFFGIELFSTFKYGKRQLFMVYLNEMTFLAEIVDNEIQIVHPLFDNPIYTHDPITNSYGNYILMNLDFYRIAKDREVSVIIIDGKRLIKLDWNEKYSR